MNEEFAAKYQKLQRVLLETLAAVEWVEGEWGGWGGYEYCPWCGQHRPDGHRADCLRQMALDESNEPCRTS